ncbi:hypothetical protein PV726_47515 [Streptomyces europaeiscabiei]|uniref:hypothetical protein n=1 Tax=Streptomyces europaeiscabiei TaxID=146819 RepID=UPI0029A88D14|nr:hypothetical protein [Streptomyces europaeiscabiei]MDX3697695.1 hypothetical protein [Streptomyces europaeiscabiei]
MRVLPARRLAVSALCATLLLGVSAPAALAADVESARDRARSAAPVPSVDSLQSQLKGLGALGGVLKPVTDLLDAVVKADNGRLSDDQATKLGKAVQDAIVKAKAEAPVTPPAALPADPAAPAVPNTPPSATKPTVPGAPVVPSAPAAPQQAVTLPAFDHGLAQPAGRTAAAPVTDALTALQAAVDTLLKAVGSGDSAQVLPAATGVVNSLVELIAATLLGSGLPAPAALPPVQTPTDPAVTPPTNALPEAPPVG